MEYTRITFRIPVDLHQELMEASEENSRSMNAEIIAWLWAWLWAWAKTRDETKKRAALVAAAAEALTHRFIPTRAGNMFP